MKKYICILLVLLMITGCKRPIEPLTKTDFYLDTVVTISLYDSHYDSILNHCFDLCNEYELIFSPSNQQSELYQINHHENKDGYQTISKELYEVIQEGLYYSELSNGAFDITIGTISSLWDFKNDESKLPDSKSINEAISHVGYQKVELKDGQIRFLDVKTMLDLGAIAKGYIADKIKEYLISQNVNNALIDLGGNIVCVGNKLDSDFNIGITNPKTVNESIIQVTINDQSVVTSGTYQRYLKQDGKIYHHILNPKTGYSYDNNLASVTIISNSSLDGDALSTVCFALGKEKGIELLDRLPDVYGCFIDGNNEITYSKGFEDYIKR